MSIFVVFLFLGLRFAGRLRRPSSVVLPDEQPAPVQPLFPDLKKVQLVPHTDPLAEREKEGACKRQNIDITIYEVVRVGRCYSPGYSPGGHNYLFFRASKSVLMPMLRSRAVTTRIPTNDYVPCTPFSACDASGITPPGVPSQSQSRRRALYMYRWSGHSASSLVSAVSRLARHVYQNLRRVAA